MLMAAAWWLTGSLTILALVVPAAAGGAVLASFGLGRWLFDVRTGLLAAALVALTPLFYQSAVVSYSEAISTLFLVLALWMYMRERTILAVVLGSLALLCKMDMAVVYGGTVAASLLYRLLYQRERRRITHSLLALLLPGLVLMGWYWLRTGSPLPTGTGRALSPEVFRLVAVDMVQNVFFVPWFIGLLLLGTIGYGAVRGLRSARLTTEQRVILASWAGLGLFVLLVYMFTPGASNTPRVLLPAWPALALLAVEGWQQFPARWRRRVFLYMGALCVVTSMAVVYFVFSHRPFQTVHADLWQELREQPQGWVVIYEPWQTLLHTRQPVTWFESDRQFQHNILHNRANFARYTEQNAIRYIPVPRQAAIDVLSRSPFHVIPAHGLYSADVVHYLEDRAEHVALPPYYDLYIVPAE
jgi:4-amino-4-deoxy-L-arabinose transferase-like glycosyltransferase